jgi:hypothetical protein
MGVTLTHAPQENNSNVGNKFSFPFMILYMTQ